MSADMVQAELDEGITLEEVRAMLASGEPVSPSAVAARAAAVMDDDEAEEASDDAP